MARRKAGTKPPPPNPAIKRKPTKEPGVRSKGDRYGDAFWSGLRDEYATGDMGYRELALSYDVPPKTLERHAFNRASPGNAGRTWGEWRRLFRDDVSRQTRKQAAENAARTLAKVREKSGSVAMLALEELERRMLNAAPRKDDDDEPIDGETGLVSMEPKDLIAAAKLAMTIKIEIAGDPEGPPVSIQARLDRLSTEDLMKLAAGKEKLAP